MPHKLYQLFVFTRGALRGQLPGPYARHHPGPSVLVAAQSVSLGVSLGHHILQLYAGMYVSCMQASMSVVCRHVFQLYAGMYVSCDVCVVVHYVYVGLASCISLQSRAEILLL